MVSRRIVAAAALAALAAGAAGNALAQVTADASLSHLSYRLIDLDPNDGILPSLSLSSSYVNGFAQQSDPNGNQLTYLTTTTFGTIAYANNYGNGSVEIQNDLVHGATQTYGGVGTTLSTRLFSFTLTPYTEVIFNADADVSASAGGPGDIAQATALLYGEIDHGPDYWFTFNSQAETLQGSEQTILSVAANGGAGWTYGTIGMLTSTYASALPVPEPASTGMLGCGLGIVATFLRRRRARS